MLNILSILENESMLTVKRNVPVVILTALLLVGSLININTFGQVTLSAYFFYTIVGALLAVVVGIGFIKSKQPIQIANPLAILVLTLLAIYYIINGLINSQGGINLRHYIILVDAVLLASYCILLNKGSINLLAISKIIVIISIIESLICILQYFSIVPSLDTLFKVTGSNVNPNVTAMFLAMALPAILFVFFYCSKSYRPSPISRSLLSLSLIASITLCLFALVLLNCRTAFIGAAVSTVLILNHQYQLLHKLKSKFSKPILIIITASTLCLTAIALTLIIHSKQASSDGRLFIWKISLQAIANKPFLGSGYGQFEHDYNLAQANYFATKAATQQEIYNASYVHMSYNEFLENLFEGGVIGLVLFVALLAVLLFPPLGDGGGDGGVFFAYAGIASFAIMCFLNFTIQAIPVRALFILYTGVCCVYYPIGSATFLRLLTLPKPLLVAKSFVYFPLGVGGRVCVLALSTFLFFKSLTLSKAYSQCNTILETSNDLGSNEALQEMAALKNDLNQSTHYLQGYAQLLFRAKHYDAAIEKYNKALDYTSNPEIYMELGNCLTKRAKFTEALQSYKIAENIEPHRFAPKYGLMKIYGFAKDYGNAKDIAQQIVAMNPKVESEKVEFYKKEARKLLVVSDKL